EEAERVLRTAGEVEQAREARDVERHHRQQPPLPRRRHPRPGVAAEVDRDGEGDQRVEGRDRNVEAHREADRRDGQGLPGDGGPPQTDEPPEVDLHRGGRRGPHGSPSTRSGGLCQAVGGGSGRAVRRSMTSSSAEGWIGLATSSMGPNWVRIDSWLNPDAVTTTTGTADSSGSRIWA